MNTNTSPFTRICMLLLALALVCGTAAAQATLDDLLGKMPAQSTAEADDASAQLVALGPDGIKALCAKVVPMGQGDDAAARFLMAGVTRYVMRPGAEQERQMVANALLEGLSAAEQPEVKAFLMSRIQLVGKDESVPALAQYLANSELCEPATQALLANTSPAATEAIVAALEKAEGRCRITLAKAAGEKRAEAAVPMILPMVDDPATRDVALYALACIAPAEAADVLAKAGQPDYLLEYAARLAEKGNVDQAAQICRELLNAEAVHVQCAALGTLVHVAGENAFDNVLAAMDSPEKDLRGAAIDLAPAFSGEAATQRWVEKLASAGPETQIEILYMLGKRGDQSATQAVLDQTKNPEKYVRMEAMKAATKLAAAEALDPLMAALQNAADDEERGVAKAALLRVPGEQVAASAAGAIPAAAPPVRVALIEVLAARKASQHKAVVLEQAKAEDESVRLAAAKALERVASLEDLPTMLGVLTPAETDAVRAGVRDSIAALAKSNPAKATAAAVAALEGADDARSVVLLPILPRITGEAALTAAAAYAKSENADVRAAAVNALAEWPDETALPALLDVVRTAQEPGLQETAMNGYIRLVESKDRAAGQKLQLYTDAYMAAQRPEEKRAVLQHAATIQTVEAFNAVMSAYDQDEAMRPDLAAAAARIALPLDANQEGLATPEIAAGLQKVLPQIQDEELRSRAVEHVSFIGTPDENNLALNKPVTTSVAQQGEKAPALAVDGRVNKDSAWHGDGSPSWLQIDLEQVHRLDKARVYFYWDGERFYQYTLEVSTDGETWQTVADASESTTPATSRGVLHEFAPTEARYVRLNVLKSSANPAVHVVEVKVYAEGAEPAADVAMTPDAEGFVPLFNGRDLTGWVGDTQGYAAENGLLVCKPGGSIYTEDEYGDFVLRFEFRLPPGGNNGLAVRTPIGGGAYNGMELQILDNEAEKYKDLQPYQYHGSIYGIVPAKRGFQKPAGEWNQQEVIAKGRQITVILNGETIVDANIDEASTPTTMDGKEHKGLDAAKGHLGFLGHGDVVEFRNIHVKPLD